MKNKKMKGAGGDRAQALGMSLKRVNAAQKAAPTQHGMTSQQEMAKQEAHNRTSVAARPLVTSHNDESTTFHPVHLHLELTHPWLDDDQKHVLWQYADATREGALTRDILIPSDMPLHHLHYVIQRLYGWQNSHLRTFQRRERELLLPPPSAVISNSFALGYACLPI